MSLTFTGPSSSMKDNIRFCRAFRGGLPGSAERDVIFLFRRGISVESSEGVVSVNGAGTRFRMD